MTSKNSSTRATKKSATLYAPSVSMSAPDLLRAAVRTGVAIGWEPSGMVFVQITDRRNRAQRAAFNAMRDNQHTPAVLCGMYYAGDFGRLQ